MTRRALPLDDDLERLTPLPPLVERGRFGIASNPLKIAADDARVLILQQKVVDSLASLPGVSSVSLMNGLPMKVQLSGSDFRE